MTTRQPLAHLADEDLMQIGSEDAARAFEVIYDRHSRPAYSLACRMLGSRTTAVRRGLVVSEPYGTLDRTIHTSGAARAGPGAPAARNPACSKGN